MEQQVKMYTLSTCSHCKAAKRLFDECTVKYEYSDVDLLTGSEREAVVEEVKRLNKDCSFPTIIIDDKIIVGFKEKEIREALNLP